MAIEVDDETNHIRRVTYFSGRYISVTCRSQYPASIANRNFGFCDRRNTDIRGVGKHYEGCRKGVVYLICLAMKDGKTCGSTAFRVRKDEKGLVVECVDCKAEHEVKG